MFAICALLLMQISLSALIESMKETDFGKKYELIGPKLEALLRSDGYVFEKKLDNDVPNSFHFVAKQLSKEALTEDSGIKSSSFVYSLSYSLPKAVSWLKDNSPEKANRVDRYLDIDVLIMTDNLKTKKDSNINLSDFKKCGKIASRMKQFENIWHIYSPFTVQILSIANDLSKKIEPEASPKDQNESSKGKQDQFFYVVLKPYVLGDLESFLKDKTFTEGSIEDQKKHFLRFLKEIASVFSDLNNDFQFGFIKFSREQIFIIFKGDSNSIKNLDNYEIAIKNPSLFSYKNVPENYSDRKNVCENMKKEADLFYTTLINIFNDNIKTFGLISNQDRDTTKDDKSKTYFQNTVIFYLNQLMISPDYFDKLDKTFKTRFIWFCSGYLRLV